MNMLSVIESTKDFKTLEEKVYKYFCNQACKCMEHILETIDEDIMKSRDKDRFRLKNSGRQNTLVTLMGDVTYRRRYYRCVDEDGVIYYDYLLDQILGINNKDKLTENVKEAAVETALRLSYRKSAETIGNNNPYEISPQTIWKEVQNAGEKAKILEDQKIESYIKGDLKGDKEVAVLFEEKDGIYLNIKGEKNKKEIKVAKVYEGWEKKTPGSKEYKTVNRFYTAGFEDGTSFDYRVNSKIAAKYNVDKIEKKIVNADGASWTKREQEYDANIIQQLDSFHIQQAILRKIKDKKVASKIRKYVNKNDFESVFILLEGLYDIAEEKEGEKIKDLLGYLSQNIDHLEKYTQRGIKLPEGIEYRNMGTLEGSHHNVICDRMKNRGMSWSIAGANNMAKLLCLKHSEGLEEIYEAVLPVDRNEINVDIKQLIDKVESYNSKVKGKHLKDSKKGSPSYGCSFSPIPFSKVKVTNGRRAIQNMLKVNNFSI